MPEQAAEKKAAAPEPKLEKTDSGIAATDGATALAAMPALMRPGLGFGGGRIPPASVVALQRRAGNRAVSRTMLQRDSGYRPPPPTNEQLIADAIKDSDVGKIKQVTSFAKASFHDKILMIDLLTDQAWIGPRDEYALEAIWGTFGDGIMEVASKNYNLWAKSLQGGAELYKLPAVKPIADKFLADTRVIAGKFLDTNETYTVTELGKLGVTEKGAPAASEADQAARAAELTAALRLARESTEAQAQMRSVTVGLERRYNMMSDSQLYFPATFDPEKAPAPDDENPPPDRIEKAKAKGMTDAQLARTPWKDVKLQWDTLDAILQGLAVAYPVVGIGLMQPKGIGPVAGGEDPKAAKAAIVSMLSGARDAIRDTKPKLAGSLAYELSPIHGQLFGGVKGASGIKWSDPVYQVVAKEVLELKQDVEFWKSMGLATLAAAAFILAEFATAGMASVALVGFGVGLGAGQAVVAWEKALTMQTAEKATTGSGTELLASGQASMATFEAALATVMVFVDAFMAAKPLGRAITGAVDHAALSAGAKVATRIGEELAALGGKAPERALVERAISELGAEQVIASTGKSATELLGIVGENSVVAARLKGLAAIPADLAKLTAPELAKRARQLAVEISTNRQTGEQVAALALERFGPKQVVEMNGGWKNLSLALGNESATGKAIMSWRDSAMGDIENFVKTLPGGVDETGKAAVKRTGSQGAFTNDFDVSLLGSHASANRQAVRSFAAGRFGTAVDRLNELLLADFFTDPRRLHMYDQLDPLLRAEVGQRAEKVAEATIFAKTLHDAEEAGNKELAAQIREQMKTLEIPEVAFKPLSEGDRAALYTKLDDYHEQLEKALASADKVAQKDLVGKIGDAQGLVNATEGGGYFSGGATRQIVTLAEGLLKGSTKPLDAQVYTALLDQLPKLNEAASSLMKSGVVAGEDAVGAIKGLAKYGARFRELMAKMEVKVADEGAWNILADKLKLILDQAKGKGELTLLARLEKDSKVVEAEINGLMTEFRASSSKVLFDLSRQAAMGGAKVDLSTIQFLVMATAKLTRASAAVRESLRAIVAQMAEAAIAAGETAVKDAPGAAPTPVPPPPGTTPPTGAPTTPPVQRSMARSGGSAPSAGSARAAALQFAVERADGPANLQRIPEPRPYVAPAGTPTPHDAAMSGDSDKVIDVPAAAWASATDSDRRMAIMAMVNKVWMWGSNRQVIVAIINSYPDLDKLQAADIDVIRRAVERGAVDGPELTRYRAITDDYQAAVIEHARLNVQRNLVELEEMAKKYGIGREPEGGASGVPTAMDELQLAAGKLTDARSAQAQLRKIQVGFKPMPNDPAGIIPSSDPLQFDPDAQPLRAQFGASGDFARNPKTGVAILSQQQGMVEWSRVKESWDNLEIRIGRTLAANPALYILAATPALDQRMAFNDDHLKMGKGALSGIETTTPDQAKKELVNAHTRSKDALTKVQEKLGSPGDPVMRNQVEVASLDELGLHVADTPRFATPYAKWAATNWLTKQQTSKERISSIIDFATAVVLIGATVATAGGAAAAAAILAGAATAGAVASAGVKFSNAADLRSTADAGIRPEDRMTSEVKASSAELEAGIATAAALLAFAASIKAITGVVGTVFRAASTAEDLALIRSGGAITPLKATEAVQKSIREVGVLATAQEAGYGQDVSKLLQHLPADGAEAKQVVALARELEASTAVKAPEIDYGKQLSASGFAGTVADRGGFGVFEGKIPGVNRPVAIKVYPDSMKEMFARDMNGARVASDTQIGPRFYGEVPAGPGKHAFAMEKIEGGFVEYMGSDSLSATEAALGKAEAATARAAVTDVTVQDIGSYRDAVIRHGHFYDGEVQGLVTKEGRWRPIDFQPVKPLPPLTDKAAYDAAIARNTDMFSMEIDQFTKIADKNRIK